MVDSLLGLLIGQIKRRRKKDTRILASFTTGLSSGKEHQGPSMNHPPDLPYLTTPLQLIKPSQIHRFLQQRLNKRIESLPIRILTPSIFKNRLSTHTHTHTYLEMIPLTALPLIPFHNRKRPLVSRVLHHEPGQRLPILAVYGAGFEELGVEF